MSVGGYRLADGPMAWVIAIGIPLVAAVAWGTFNVPGDRSRSGEAPVPVSGRVRLGLELVFFATAVALFWAVDSMLAVVLGSLVVIHYGLSLDRIRWLLKNSS